jgi:hypothetical protein
MGARARGQRGDPIWGAPGQRNSLGCGPPQRRAQARENYQSWCFPVSKAARSWVTEELLNGVILDDGSAGSIRGLGRPTTGRSLWRRNGVAQWLRGGL